MSDDKRPDPDALLEALKREETKQQRGKLKIFLGMSAGVGKTYAMLEAAQQRLADGIDVVVGYVETHKRVETEALLEGLPVIPRHKLDYRGSTLEEMDVDAILARKPQLVLVDELAHTNVPGTRHPKRYQDVLDLLTAGMDVYTTVNVQHFESRADAVRQITGITVHETVPDMLIDIANDIELIDLEPEELLKRLAEGKVYTPDRAELAVKNFFRKGNLTALREMALRLTAERVDQEMQDYMQIKRISGPWKSAERLMVAVSPSPLSGRLVRWTRRVAYNLKAPWLAVFVEPTQPLPDYQKTQLTRNLSLVHKLGGEVVTTSGNDVVETLMRVARQRNVTQIVIGKPAHNRLQELLRGGSVVNQLVHASGEIDVYVVTGDKEEESERPLLPRPQLSSGPNQYLVALLVVLAAVGICYVISVSSVSVVVGYQEVALILLLVMVLLANFLGRGPILVAATLSALLWNYLFIPPRFTLFITSLRDILIFGLYFLVALVTGNLTARQRAQAKALRLREERMSAFSTMAQEVAHALTLNDVLRTAVEQVSQVFDAEIAILLPDATGHLSNTLHEKSTLNLDQKEWSVATWAFEHGQTAGRFTETLPTAIAQYVPLVTPGGVVGVMGILRSERPSVDQEVLLNTFANHIALAVEHALLAETAQQTAVLAESERLASTLLDSVSQELRTPIAAIREAATVLMDAHKKGNEEAELAYGDEIQAEATQLTRVVDNLLDMTRLESGHLQLNLGWHSVSDLVSQSIRRVEKELATHDLVVDVPADLPVVQMDSVLMEQVLVNLLHNSAMHAPKGVRVCVTARVEGLELVVSVADRGPGLPPADLNRVFEKFYRAPGSAPGGTGLGLSICRGLVEAHGGTISAENRPHGGARFTVRLPIDGGSSPSPKARSLDIPMEIHGRPTSPFHVDTS
jgi:two-component system sensor histidine kinase KdpD